MNKKANTVFNLGATTFFVICQCTSEHICSFPTRIINRDPDNGLRVNSSPPNTSKQDEALWNDCNGAQFYNGVRR